MFLNEEPSELCQKLSQQSVHKPRLKPPGSAMGSLDLLLNSASRAREDPNSEAKAAAIREITTSCHMHVALMNARAWTDPAWRQIADDEFLANTKSHCFSDHISPNTLTLQDYLATCRAFTDDMPEFWLEVKAVNVSLDEPEDGEADALPDRATSLIVSRSRGWGNGLRKESISWMRWRRLEGGRVWRANVHVNFRGPGWLEE